MKITVSSRGIERSGAVEVFLRRKLEAALKRVSEDVFGVDVFLSDENGPKGGVDKQVVLRVHLKNRQSVTINAVHESLRAAITNAAHRARRAAHRSLRRSRRIARRQLHEALGRSPAHTAT